MTNYSFNQFHILGRANVLSKDNQDFPGVYVELLETKELVPVSIPDSLQSQLSFIGNGDLIGIKGKVSMKGTEILLIAERIVIISKATGGKHE